MFTAAKSPEEVSPWAINMIVEPCHARWDWDMIEANISLMCDTEA